MEPKFRIKVLVRNDGKEMFVPQIFYVTKVQRSWFGKYTPSYDYRSFRLKSAGEKTEILKSPDEIGNYSFDLEGAKELINKYKMNLDLNISLKRREEEKKSGESIKETYFIEL